MDCKLGIPSGELFMNTVPGYVLGLYGAKGFETITVSGYEDDEPVAYAVFSRMYMGGDVYLEFFYTKPGSDSAEYGKRLMEYCSSYFTSLGLACILSKKYILPHEAEGWHDDLKKLGFLPLYLSGRLKIYRLLDTEMAGVRATILRNIERLPETCSFREAGENRFRSFMKKIGRGDVSGMAAYIPYSRFYVAGDEISGAMLAQKCGPDRIHISLTYLDDTAVKDNVFLVLLTEVLTAVEKTLGTDYTFAINVDSDLIERGLMQVFNPPDEEYFLLEHVFPLQGLGISPRERIFPAGEMVLPPSGEKEITSDIMTTMSLKENHFLSEKGFLELERLSDEGFSLKRSTAEKSFHEAYSAFAEQEKKNQSAKKAKEYLISFWDLKEKLHADPSLDEAEISRRLYEFTGDISEEVEIFRELYVEKLGGGKRKERILRFLQRFDEIRKSQGE